MSTEGRYFLERFETRDLVSYNQWAFSSKSLGKTSGLASQRDFLRARLCVAARRADYSSNCYNNYHTRVEPCHAFIGARP